MSNKEDGKPKRRRGRPFQRARENTIHFIRGSYASPDRETRKGMLELGDDLGLLARLERDLMRAWKPQDSMQALIVADMAKLYWKKTHLERTVVANRAGEMRRVEQAITLHNADENSSDSPIDPVQTELSGYRGVSDSGEAYEESTSLLNRILKLVEERDWTADLSRITTLLYGKELPPHGSEILQLYARLADAENDMTGEEEQTAAAQLRNVVMMEKASVLIAQTMFRVRRRNRVLGSLGSSWVPTTGNWDLVVAEEAHLDRMIESKIRLLIRLQGLGKSSRQAAVGSGQAPSESDEIPVGAILHRTSSGESAVPESSEELAAAVGSRQANDDGDAIPVEAILHRHPSHALENAANAETDVTGTDVAETGENAPHSGGENPEKDPFLKLTVNIV